MLLLLAVLAMMAPPMAGAQERTPTPSGETLWREYPLHAENEPTPTPAEAEPVETRPVTAPAPGPDDDGPLVEWAAALGAFLALAGVLTRLRRRSDRHRVVPIAALAGPLLPAGLVTAMAPRGPRRLTDLATSPGRSAGGDPVARPPDPRKSWTAEVEWREKDGRALFVVVARAGEDGKRVAIFSSEPLDWPPADPKAGQRLTDVAGRLEAAVLAAGWTPLPPGSAWYAKRFAWPADRPVAALPQAVPEPGTRRFARPEDPPSEHLWRCEIRWRPGYVNSHFEAVAIEPPRRRRVTVCRSPSFRWLMMAEPSSGAAEQVEQVRRIAEQLTAAGWERVGRGKRWYELRFLWRRDGAPPEHLELAPADASGERDA